MARERFIIDAPGMNALSPTQRTNLEKLLSDSFYSVVLSGTEYDKDEKFVQSHVHSGYDCGYCEELACDSLD